MKTNTKYLTILFLLLMMISCTCLKWHKKTPEGLIDSKKTKELHNNYKNNQYRFINASVNNDSVIIGEETVFEKPFPNMKTASPNKKNGGDELGYLEIELNQTNTASSPISGFEDSFEALFSLDEVGSFLVSTKRKAESSGKTNIGIRIYYGSYIINNQLKTTVIFVPTHFDRNKHDIDDIGDPSLHENIYDLPCLNYGNTGQLPKKYEPNRN